MTDHPITPPPELVQQWREQVPRYRDGGIGREYWLMARAAQWGADQQLKLDAEQIEQIAQAFQAGADHELEACCEWMRNQSLVTFNDRIPLLRAARRPKPPSLKEQALNDLADAYNADKINDTTYENIRLALEALPDD
jgi:hypothetical protein